MPRATAPSTISTPPVLPIDPILAEADRCVKCGLCLPKCPTYGLFRDEAESPRGRISLMQGLVGGQLRPSTQLRAHLDHCLACRACETACPSGVRYGRLIDLARERLLNSRPPVRRLMTGVLIGLLTGEKPLRAGGALLHGLQRLAGTKRALDRLPAIRDLAASLPTPGQPHSLKALYPATGVPVGRVNLFTGCVARVLELDTLLAGVRVLNRLGWEVAVPEGQGCCGAMHRHAGYARRAQTFARQNLAAFSGDVPIVTLASGCGAHLADYPAMFKTEQDARPRDLARRVHDISAFLVAHPWPERVKLRALNTRIAIHAPCTLTNGLRQAGAPAQLLRRIPEAEVADLPGNEHCCGAAGTYVLTEPAISRRLRAAKLDDVRAAAPDVVVTSNIGCALHLRAGLRAAGLDVEVLHPVQLLERQMVGDT